MALNPKMNPRERSHIIKEMGANGLTGPGKT